MNRVLLPDMHCGKSRGPSLCVVAAIQPHPLSPQLQGPWWVEVRVKGETQVLVLLPSLQRAGGWGGKEEVGVRWEGVKIQLERRR